MPLVTKSSFERSLLRVEPQLRKLLSDLDVQTAGDLARLDILELFHQQGIGRGTLRELQALMRELGVSAPARPRASASPRLSVSFPAELSEAIRKAAAQQRSSPNDWVLRAIASSLDAAEREERAAVRPRVLKLT